MENSNLSMCSKNVTYAGLNIGKFIMAFVVVAIHSRNATYSYGQYPSIILWLTTLAVPFFFVTSGFLLARKLEKFSSVSEKENVLLDRSKQMFGCFSHGLLSISL